MSAPEKMETPETIEWDQLVAEARRDICFFRALLENPQEALMDRGLTMSPEDLDYLARMHDSGQWEVDRSTLSQEEAEQAAADQSEVAGIATMAVRGRWKKT